LAFDSVPDRFDRRIREIEHRSHREPQCLDELRERRTSTLRNGAGLTSGQLWPRRLSWWDRRSLSTDGCRRSARWRYELSFLLRLSLDFFFAAGRFVDRIFTLARTFAFTHSSRSA
jgi:hypothetical protein